MKIRKSNTRLEDLNEIIESPPNIFHFWGNISVIFLILFLFIFSIIIKSPEKIYSEVIITSNNTSNILIAKKEGIIDSLFIKDGSYIKPNTIISNFENNSSIQDVLYLETISKYYLNSDNNDTINYYLNCAKKFNLGELSLFFNNLYESFTEYNLIVNLINSKNELSLLNKELIMIDNLLVKYYNQKRITNEEYTILEKDFIRNEYLESKGVITKVELEKKKKELLNQLKLIEEVSISLSNLELRKNEKIKDVLHLQISYKMDSSIKHTKFINSLRELKNQIDSWKQLNLFISPKSGYLNYTQIVKEKHFINKNEVLFYIRNSNDNIDYYASTLISENNSGGVNVGMKALIKLYNYPHEIYGKIEGRISKISSIQVNDKYLVEIKLNNELVTTFNKRIEFKENMKGEVEIYLSETSLFNRIKRKTLNAY